ncbi:hypothetical protein [Paenibacillus agricola]|uniref:Beta-galactosidase trimerisation domain-containing protein n=1 Tax=Paenibacillus agricola TaxID=2716264 RepID=A0ABX0J7V5_9BACL|nr:hypothetical protein [Paenibacillus agricola]NHN32512.1 hypothetical protein [Paenibacillus agricola]
MWWNELITVVQTNLQIKDAVKIKPKELAEQVYNMGADALIFNVGGIYAWYPSEIKYHNHGDFLAEYPTLLEEVIDECHKKGMKFIARFDFGTAVDYIYDDHPEWFVQKTNREPNIIGAHRPGGWQLLYQTCINAPYRNEAVGVPVMREALTKYKIDGVFINGPHPRNCWCDNCRRKYLKLFNENMPDNPREFNSGWNTIQYKENISKYYDVIKKVNKDIPLILYYMFENVTEDCFVADIICAEARNSLSEGLTQVWQPAVRMKLCDIFSKGNPSWGFVHSAPGLDWRHVGLPPVEYAFWLSQIPANGATLIHSLTGIPDTILDKRIIDNVTWANQCAKLTYPAMKGKVAVSDIAVLYNEIDPQSNSNDELTWMNVLLDIQMPYSVLIEKDAVFEKMSEFKLIVKPNGYKMTAKVLDSLKEYVSSGGKLIYEGSIEDEFLEMYPMCGIKPYGVRSSYLDASYFRMEPAGEFLSENGLENTVFSALRGEVFYCTPESAELLATLVPPHVPASEAFTPPERASMLTSHTHIPICLMNQYGDGRVATITFDIAKLYADYQIVDHLVVLRNLIYNLIGAPTIKTTSMQGLYITMFEDENAMVVHLTNGAGKRPLLNVTPLFNIDVTLNITSISSVKGLIVNKDIPFVKKDDGYHFTVDQLDTWECFEIIK